jgi:putative ABC transport system permease protein
MLPLPARMLLRLTDPAVREFVAGDLEEGFATIARTEGPSPARRWSVRQALAAVQQHPWKPNRPRQRGDGFMRTLMQDLRYGLRMVRRQPTFSLVVVITLALAIGANTVIFSFANIFLLRPLPLEDPDHMGWIFTTDPHTGSDRGLVSIPELMDYRGALTSFASLSGTSRTSVTLTGRGDAKRLTASRVTANLTDVWGLRFQLGRGFTPAAENPGAPGEVLLSHHYWDRELARDPSIVGQSLTIDGRPATVMGVLDPAIEIGNLSEIDVWTPVTLSADASRAERILRVSGRLKPGVTLAQAGADVVRVAHLVAREHPKTNEGWSAKVAPTREAMVGLHTFDILTLLGLVVGLVLLLACANLANLVLSRATGRRRELALRSALGASRPRVIRQMLTENVVYGVCGGLLGLGIANGALAIMRAVAYEPFFQIVRIDRNVLAFTAILALLTPLLFAILPALQSTRAEAAETLKDGGTRTAGGVRATRSRAVLVVAQLGLAVMLLVLATLLVHALVNLADAPLGIDQKRLLSAKFDLPAWRYTTAPAIAAFDDQLIARLRGNPGIEDAALVDRLPFLDGEPISEVAIEGRAASRPEDRPWAVCSTVSEHYFATLGISTLAGRVFESEDREGRAPVAIVNREMARRFWGGPEGAVGARMTVAGEPVQIVGVVSDVLRADREAINPQVYRSWRQRPRSGAGQASGAMALVVRTPDPSGIVPAVRAEMRGLDTDVPLYEMRSYQQALDEDMSSSRVLGSLFVAFALLALVLAASGLYAVVSYAASQRVKEFGVRIALGAAPGDIARMMLRQTGTLVAIGLVLGLIGGRALATLATALLYQVSPSDPATYAGVAVTLGAIALVASYIPVRRATAVDPVQALRLE